MAAKKKKKSKLLAGEWIDEHGYCRRDDAPELPAKWYDVSPMLDHRRDFILRYVARHLHDGNVGGAVYVMSSDLHSMMAENHRLRQENKKLRIKLRKATR